MFVFGAQKNGLIETVHLSTNNIMFRLRNKKNNFQLHTLILGPDNSKSKMFNASNWNFYILPLNSNTLVCNIS